MITYQILMYTNKKTGTLKGHRRNYNVFILNSNVRIKCNCSKHRESDATAGLQLCGSLSA